MNSRHCISTASSSGLQDRVCDQCAISPLISALLRGIEWPLPSTRTSSAPQPGASLRSSSWLASASSNGKTSSSSPRVSRTGVFSDASGAQRASRCNANAPERLSGRSEPDTLVHEPRLRSPRKRSDSSSAAVAPSEKPNRCSFRHGQAACSFCNASSSVSTVARSVVQRRGSLEGSSSPSSAKASNQERPPSLYGTASVPSTLRLAVCGSASLLAKALKGAARSPRPWKSKSRFSSTPSAEGVKRKMIFPREPGCGAPRRATCTGSPIRAGSPQRKPLFMHRTAANAYNV